MSLADKLALAEQKAEKYQDLANDPELSLPAALWARNLARSYRAAVQLGQKAQAYKDQNDKALQATLARALGTLKVPHWYFQPDGLAESAPLRTFPDTSRAHTSFSVRTPVSLG
jgi:hypothetical protein